MRESFGVEASVSEPTPDRSSTRGCRRRARQRLRHPLRSQPQLLSISRRRRSLRGSSALAGSTRCGGLVHEARPQSDRELTGAGQAHRGSRQPRERRIRRAQRRRTGNRYHHGQVAGHLRRRVHFVQHPRSGGSCQTRGQVGRLPNHLLEEILEVVRRLNPGEGPNARASVAHRAWPRPSAWCLVPVPRAHGRRALSCRCTGDRCQDGSLFAGVMRLS